MLLAADRSALWPVLRSVFVIGVDIENDRYYYIWEGKKFCNGSYSGFLKRVETNQTLVTEHFHVG